MQSLLYEDVTRNGWFRGNPSSVRVRWQIYGFLVTAAGAGLTWLLAQTWQTRYGLVGLAVVVSGLVLLALSSRMPARTPKGTAMLAQAKGFRTYLETAEANQIKFEEGEDVFSRYLPFAIVFGVAERWAKVFADLAASGAPVATPTWYVGPMWGTGCSNYLAFGQHDGLLRHDHVGVDRGGHAVVVRIVRVRGWRVLRRRWRRRWRRLLVTSPGRGRNTAGPRARSPMWRCARRRPCPGEIPWVGGPAGPHVPSHIHMGVTGFDVGRRSRRSGPRRRRDLVNHSSQTNRCQFKPHRVRPRCLSERELRQPGSASDPVAGVI